jgi:mannosyl-glycoprotein endo-beta-N-acetylglucosaminidase
LKHARPKLLWFACVLALAACAQMPRGDASGINFALDRPATGSPICKPGEEVEKAFNGRAESWTQDKFCTLETPSWLQVDLGEVRTVRSFTVKHAGAAGEAKAMNTRAFRIRTSLDGEAWDTAIDVTNNAMDVTVHDISPREARYVRLDVTGPTQDFGDPATRIYELEVR